MAAKKEHLNISTDTNTPSLSDLQSSTHYIFHTHWGIKYFVVHLKYSTQCTYSAYYKLLQSYRWTATFCSTLNQGRHPRDRAHQRQQRTSTGWR